MELEQLIALGILFLLALGCGAICHWIADWRQGNVVFWGSMGFVFGPFAIPFAFFARRVGSEVPER